MTKSCSVSPARITLISGVILLLASRHAGATDISYTIRFPDAKNHYADVELTCPADGEAELELMMATWTPGSYLIREYARHVETISAVNDDGRDIAVSRSSTNRWLVHAGDARSVVIRYRLYCREMTVRTNWVDADFALLNGAPTYITPVGSQDQSHRVRIELPDSWEHAVCPLPGPHDEPTTFVAADFDELVDSPILCGNPEIYPFKVGGHEHQLVSLGEDSIWDGEATVRDLEKIVAEHQRMWGVIPYERYIFFNLLVETGGGLEHDNSTVMMISRWYYRDREKYIRWLGLASHEFFHTWNVRRLRPKALTEYDYESEVHFRTLWIAEGITSYYDDLALTRSGLITRREYLERLSKQIENLQTTPGRHIQSLDDASFDAWIKFYRRNENTRNAQVNYYNKGAVAAFLLDARIRRITSGEKSLDHVMRILYERHAGQTGYTAEDFRKIVEEICNRDMSGWFGRYIDGTEEFDYAPALEWYGLEFSSDARTKQPSEAEETSSEEAAEKAEEKQAWTGLTTENEDGHLVVKQVLRDSPGYEAGINVGDEILAIDDYRVTPDDLDSRLKQYQPGDSVEFLISRRGKLQPMEVTFGRQPADRWKLSVTGEPSDDQKQHLTDWLQPG